MGLAAAALVALALAASAQENPQQANRPTMLVQRGLMALQARDVPAAQELLERAVEESPDDARAWIALAQVFGTLNLRIQSSRHASEAARLGGDQPLIQHALAMFYTDFGDLAEAARWEERFAGGEMGSEEAYLRTMSLYMQAGMPLKAASVGVAAIDSGSVDSAAMHNVLGKAYTMAGNLDDGLRHLKLAVQSNPYEESMHYDLGYFHLRNQDFGSAATAFQEGRRYFDKSAAIEIGLGIAAYGQRKFEEAVDRFLHAAELAPGLEQPHAFLGRLLQHATSRIDDVEERFRAFHEQDSASHFGPLLYGQVLLARPGARRDAEALARAESLFEESIDRKEDYWESHYELGVLLESRRELVAAEKHLQRAATLNPESSKPHYRLARVYQRLGKTQEARRERELHKRIAERERETMKATGLPGDLVGPIGSRNP